MGFRGLDDVELVLAGLSLGHDFCQQSFADGAKHGRLDKRILGFKRVVEFLRLINRHRRVNDDRAFFLGALNQRFIDRLKLSGGEDLKNHREEKKSANHQHCSHLGRETNRILSSSG